MRKLTKTKMIPLAKQSKAKQREYYTAKRGSWHGVRPTSRIVRSAKVYDRNRIKRDLQRRSGNLARM